MKQTDMKQTITRSIKQSIQLIGAALALGLSQLSGANITELAPPKYDVVDKNSVNMFAGSVQLSKTDVSIGGELGLTHTISSQSGNFIYYGDSYDNKGFRDNFHGGIYGVRYGNFNNTNAVDQDPYNIWVLRAYGNGQSADFIIKNGQYIALENKYNSLRYDSSQKAYIMTLADGTELVYPSTTKHTVVPDTFRAPMSEIRHPNGFTITINRKGTSIASPITEVKTNTGYQLYYVYQSDSRGNVPDAGPHKGSTAVWAQKVPKCIVARNLQRNIGHDSASCSANYTKWPKAVYDWPAGMPAAMFSGEKTFTVTDSLGRKTDYVHKGFLDASQAYYSRITQVNDKTSGTPILKYSYSPKRHHASVNPMGLFSWFAGYLDQGMYLDNAWNGPGLSDNTTYGTGNAEYAHGNLIGFRNTSGGFQNVEMAKTSYHGLMTEIRAWDKTVYFNQKYGPDPTGKNVEWVNNRVSQIISYLGNTQTYYEYDSRGNLTKTYEYSTLNAHLKTPQSRSDYYRGLVAESTYEPTCTTSNRKYCNKPKQFRNANGAVTDFAYYPETGLLKTVTTPPNGQGVRSTTHYKYAPHYGSEANYFGTQVKYTKPVYLKTHEITCEHEQANYSVNAESCSVGNKIVTRYEYNHPNLHLTSTIMEAKNAQGVQESRRTCYQYDLFGNQTGVISPKAGRAHCN